MIDKEILNKYADIKLKIKELEAEADELNPLITAELVKEEEGSVVQLDGKGSFSIYMKRKWIYSKPIKDAEEQLKKAKKEEEAKGFAEYEETPILKFINSSSKDKDE